MRKLLALAVLCLSASCAAHAPRTVGTLSLVDLTDDFARIYDRDAALPDGQRTARFKSEFATLLPGFYDEKRVKIPVERYDAFLLRNFRKFPEQRAGIERVSREFAGLLVPAQRSFEREFGPMTGYLRSIWSTA